LVQGEIWKKWDLYRRTSH